MSERIGVNMQIILLMLLIPLAIALIKLAGTALFWLLAFADIAVVAGLTAFAVHTFFGLHTVFIIAITVLAAGTYLLILKLPVVKYVLPVAVCGFVSYQLIMLVSHGIMSEPLDALWTWALIAVLTIVFVTARFRAMDNLSSDGDSASAAPAASPPQAFTPVGASAAWKEGV